MEKPAHSECLSLLSSGWASPSRRRRQQLVTHLYCSPDGLSACGGGATTKVEARGTQGQQLLDLKEAYDKGVITEKEYNRTREDILDS